MNKILTFLIVTTFVSACQDQDVRSESYTDLSADTSTFTKDTLQESLDSKKIAVDTNEIIKSVLAQTTYFDDNILFSTDTFEFFDKTKEGGVAYATHNKGSDLLSIKGTIFGEMGKTEYKFYMPKKGMKLMYAMFNDIAYDRNVHEKNMKIKSSNRTVQIFQDGKLITVLNDKRERLKLNPEQLLKIEKETHEFYSDYIGQIKIIK